MEKLYQQSLLNILQTNDDESFYYHFENGLQELFCVILHPKDMSINNHWSWCIASKLKPNLFYRFLIPTKLEIINWTLDKDGIISICKILICNLDELVVLSQIRC